LQHEPTKQESKSLALWKHPILKVIHNKFSNIMACIANSLVFIRFPTV
jgi:hypothetical protein